MMAGTLVSFHFHGELNDFLAPAKRDSTFEQLAGPTDTLKHVIESIGVPHTEVGRITVNNQTVLDSAHLASGDRIEVFPHQLPILLENPRFILDGHLGRLAAYLRMLGFDVRYDRFADDACLASIASAEHRTLLTRDVGLLKRREIHSGYCVRNHKPHDQLREISSRFSLHAHFEPFRRCMDCNGDLYAVSKEEIATLLPPHTRETKEEFSRCCGCQKIFWRGSHYTRMLTVIDNLIADAERLSAAAAVSPGT